ncbi:MAG: Nif3-like dinuclear metal center hexameric protein [Candidatus Margulisiibacteriota bacterium]
MKLKALIGFLNKVAPPHLACPWDKIGLQVGDKETEVNKVLVALDVTEKTVRKAVKQQADVIVAHHPLIFNTLDKLDFSKPQGKLLKLLIENNIAVYVMHTNLDAAAGGVNDVLAQEYGLDPASCKVLEPTYKEPLYKLSVFVPETKLDTVRKAICDAGAGFIGNYSHCTFSSPGEGTFLGLEGTNPYIGEACKLEKADERRLETIVPASILDSVVSVMINAHPYEEVAYDIYLLKQSGKTYGLGRIGKTAEGKTLAVCSGAGGKLIAKAAEMGAGRYIVGEAGYHDLLEAEALGIKVEVIGHFESENIIVPILAKKIKEQYGKELEVCKG